MLIQIFCSKTWNIFVRTNCWVSYECTFVIDEEPCSVWDLVKWWAKEYIACDITINVVFEFICIYSCKCLEKTDLTWKNDSKTYSNVWMLLLKEQLIVVLYVLTIQILHLVQFIEPKKIIRYYLMDLISVDPTWKQPVLSVCFHWSTAGSLTYFSLNSHGGGGGPPHLAPRWSCPWPLLTVLSFSPQLQEKKIQLLSSHALGALYSGILASAGMPMSCMSNFGSLKC